MMVKCGEERKTRLLVKGVVRGDLCQKRAEHVLLREQRSTRRGVQMGNLAHVRERHRSYTL
jgi:hypothetical protein